MGERFDTLARTPHFWLILQPGTSEENVVEVKAGRAVIGRDQDCQVVVDDPSVSRHHAAIWATPGAPLVLEDLDSANGTLVNGRPLRTQLGFQSDPTRRAELRGGEVLQFGDALAVISLIPPSSDPPED